MITKERLEELQKNGATIWQIKNNGEFNVVLPIKLNYVTINYLDEGIEVKSDVYMLFKISEAYECIYFMRYEELTENEEEANFISRYQGITRTETLNLPTWQEIEKEEFYKLYFYNHLGREFCLQIENYGSDDNICVSCSNDYNDLYEIFDRPITKANYIEACELCRKLFLGEVE